MTSLNDIARRDLLLMAVALHGVSLEVIRAPNRRITAKGRPILRQVLWWLEQWDDVSRSGLCGDVDDPRVNELYQSLIDMSCAAKELVLGFGNLGNDETGPCDPIYSSFGLSEQGWRRAELLFAKYPELRLPSPITG